MIPTMLMGGGGAAVLACADTGARTPIGVSGKKSIVFPYVVAGKYFCLYYIMCFSELTSLNTFVFSLRFQFFYKLPITPCFS